jgi:hypothetical protein
VQCAQRTACATTTGYTPTRGCRNAPSPAGLGAGAVRVLGAQAGRGVRRAYQPHEHVSWRPLAMRASSAVEHTQCSALQHRACQSQATQAEIPDAPSSETAPAREGPTDSQSRQQLLHTPPHLLALHLARCVVQCFCTKCPPPPPERKWMQFGNRARPPALTEHELDGGTGLQMTNLISGNQEAHAMRTHISLGHTKIRPSLKNI